MRLQLATTLRDAGKEAEAYAVLQELMPFWNLSAWGDGGRMRLLSASIPLAVSLHQCVDADEMAKGLKVFVRLAREAAAKGVSLPSPPGGLQPPSIEEGEKVGALAGTCR